MRYTTRNQVFLNWRGYFATAARSYCLPAATRAPAAFRAGRSQSKAAPASLPLTTTGGNKYSPAVNAAGVEASQDGCTLAMGYISTAE